MSYPVMTRNFRASSTSTGTMNFNTQEPGFYVSPNYTALYVADTPLQSFDIQIGGAATVVIEGNDWNPDTAADWYTLSSVTASGQVKLEEEAKFVRARVSAYTSGSVVVNFAAFG